MEQVAAEVKAEDSALPKNNVKLSTTKSTTTTKKTTNAQDSSSKTATYPKVNGRTVTKKSNTSSGVSSYRSGASGRSPVTGRRNPPMVSNLFHLQGF